jgi:DNA-binding NtrC family response regulator
MNKGNGRILVVDDEPEICKYLSVLMQKQGLAALVAQDGNMALKMIASEAPDIILSDIRMPGMDGMELLKEAKKLDPDIPVIMITGYADIHGAVEAMRAGAHDYLAKPFNHHEVIRVVQRALVERDLKQKIKHLSDQLQDTMPLSKMMGPSDAVRHMISDVNRVAKSDFSVVILGETGSGKELVAKAIHTVSPRSGYPFVPVDCGAIPESLLESELFGHEKWSFTGADRQKPGKFDAAKGGSLFLDEILNMPLSSQAKLLRALQEKTVYRVGGTKPLTVDVRLLVASNKDLESAVTSGLFRRDLFYRLNEFTIKIPPLRERREDIPYLAKRFLETTNMDLGKSVKGFSESAVNRLLTYHWPGNVRQLRSAIRRAVLLADDIVTESHLDMHQLPRPGLPSTSATEDMPWGDLSLKEMVRRNNIALEREALTKVLQYTGGNKAKAARILKIDYKTIHTKIKQLGISMDGGKYG